VLLGAIGSQGRGKRLFLVVYIVGISGDRFRDRLLERMLISCSICNLYQGRPYWVFVVVLGIFIMLLGMRCLAGTVHCVRLLCFVRSILLLVFLLLRLGYRSCSPHGQPQFLAIFAAAFQEQRVASDHRENYKLTYHFVSPVLLLLAPTFL
jgi:hypothetical protein